MLNSFFYSLVTHKAYSSFTLLLPDTIIFHTSTQGCLNTKGALGKYGGNFLGIVVKCFLFPPKCMEFCLHYIIMSSDSLIPRFTVGETVEIGNFDPKIATFWIDSGNIAHSFYLYTFLFPL